MSGSKNKNEKTKARDIEQYQENGDFVVKSFSLTEDQITWLNQNIKNSSKLIRDLLDDYISKNGV